MDPISNADRLVLLLRQKLEERAKTASGSRAATKPQAPASGVRALAAIDWSDERPLRRAIIQNLLADQLGPDLINDAQFQQVVSRVADVIEEDGEAAALLSRVVSDLRHS